MCIRDSDTPTHEIALPGASVHVAAAGTSLAIHAGRASALRWVSVPSPPAGRDTTRWYAMTPPAASTIASSTMSTGTSACEPTWTGACCPVPTAGPELVKHVAV